MGETERITGWSATRKKKVRFSYRTQLHPHATVVRRIISPQLERHSGRCLIPELPLGSPEGPRSIFRNLLKLDLVSRSNGLIAFYGPFKHDEGFYTVGDQAVSHSSRSQRWLPSSTSSLSRRALLRNSPDSTTLELTLLIAIVR